MAIDVSAYSLVALADDMVIGVRDPLGVRPLRPIIVIVPAAVATPAKPKGAKSAK